MALFDVFYKGKSVKVVKVDKAKDGVAEGFTYAETIVSSTKVVAQKQAETRFSSGAYQLKKNSSGDEKLSDSKIEKPVKALAVLPTIQTHPVKKAIYCDFNGVLDDRELDKTVSRSESDAFRLPKIACPHKVYKLAKLAVDTNAEVVLTSMYRLYGIDLYVIIARCLSHCAIPEYVSYFEENRKTIRELTNKYPTGDLNNRSAEVRQHILENGYTHFVVFEDEHYIKEELNPIMTQWSVGLLDEHINKAYSVLLA